jgi:hypothetical protein
MNADWRSGLVFTCVAVAGWDRAPSLDILGSYVPGWLVSVIVALVLAVLVRFLLRRLEIELAAPIVAYPSLVAWLTFAQWLLFLQ